MAYELKMPKLGESVTEGTIGKWLKQPGEKVNKYDLLVEVQTDKVNTEIPSPVAGTAPPPQALAWPVVPLPRRAALPGPPFAAAAAAPAERSPRPRHRRCRIWRGGSRSAPSGLPGPSPL
ncbi:MAG: hypothetical protein E6I28_13695 [Chloroflexi bacterium]|nr:MAG: hypothetical protein E6I28_13695 [Chloroflexota bacterium]